MKLFGNRRRAAHTKKSALSRGTRTALIAAVIVLAVAGSAFAAWKLLVKPVERPALSGASRRGRSAGAVRRSSHTAGA
jgi:hypothetical protein